MLFTLFMRFIFIHCYSVGTQFRKGTNIINQCQERPANVTVRQWLKDNDINEKSCYYWLRKFRKESYDQMQIPAVTENPTEIFFLSSLLRHRRKLLQYMSQRIQPRLRLSDMELSIWKYRTIFQRMC